LLSALFAALIAIFAKIGIRNIDSDLVTAIRTIVILVIVWAIAFIRGGTSTMGTLTKNNLLFLILSGAAIGLSWIFYFRALHYGKVSQVVPVDKLSVVLAIMFSAVFGGESVSLKTALGAGCIIMGSLIIIF